MDERLIIRPTVRGAHRQLVAGIALATAFVAYVGVTDGPGGLWLAAASAALALLAGVTIQHHVRLTGPRAIAATSEYLGLLAADGTRGFVRWDAVRCATHSTGLEGMRWELDTEHGTVELHDVGVDPDRWGRLWWLVGRQVAQRGRPVRVDRLSDALFD